MWSGRPKSFFGSRYFELPKVLRFAPYPIYWGRLQTIENIHTKKKNLYMFVVLDLIFPTWHPDSFLFLIWKPKIGYFFNKLIQRKTSKTLYVPRQTCVNFLTTKMLKALVSECSVINNIQSLRVSEFSLINNIHVIHSTNKQLIFVLL